MIPFCKVHGIGNDFIVLDSFTTDLSQLDLIEFAIKTCNRHYGIGADGLLVLGGGQSAPIRMDIFNSDGSPGTMCGNGIRCLAILASQRGYVTGNKFGCETPAGIKQLEIVGQGMAKVEMGLVTLQEDESGLIPHAVSVDGRELVGTRVLTGNPHFVIFVDNPAQIDLERVGPMIESHESFPNQTNVHFCKVLSSSLVVQRTWERGAGATLGCGTGACAVVAAGKWAGLVGSEAIVQLPGGELQIQIDESNHATMIGPAEIVFEGTWNS